MKITLDTSLKDYDAIYKLVYPPKGRSPKNMTIPRQLLVTLLIDHGRLVAACEEDDFMEVIQT